MHLVVVVLPGTQNRWGCRARNRNKGDVCVCRSTR